MNEELADRYREEVEATLGYEGRLIAWSKSGYERAHPEHAPVFNANVCLAGGKIWHGDLDLTVDEPLLAELSRRSGEVVFVLSELDGRFAHEAEPLLERAVYSVAPSGHSRFRYQDLERSDDGSLRRRPPPPDQRPRLQRQLLLRWRPRLWRFWQLELEHSRERADHGREQVTLLYLGRSRDGAPFLVLELVRRRRPFLFLVESVWYPSRGEPARHTPRPLLRARRQLRLRRLRIIAGLLLWPGRSYELRLGLGYEQP